MELIYLSIHLSIYLGGPWVFGGWTRVGSPPPEQLFQGESVLAIPRVQYYLAVYYYLAVCFWFADLGSFGGGPE
jgi:hypothetical protein